MLKGNIKQTVEVLMKLLLVINTIGRQKK